MDRSLLKSRAVALYGPNPFVEIARLTDRLPQSVSAYQRDAEHRRAFWSAILVCEPGAVGTVAGLRAAVPRVDGWQARAGRIAAALAVAPVRGGVVACLPVADVRAALESDADTDSLLATIPRGASTGA